VPMPLAGDVNCSHGAVLVAVQVQPERPVSATVPFSAAEEMLVEFGLIAKLQGGPACVIVMLCDPTVMAPVRVGTVEFAATVKPMLPSPVPCCPKSMVIQLTVAAASRTQLLALAVTLTTPAPPARGNDCGLDDSVKTQVCALATPTRAVRTQISRGPKESYPASSSSIFFCAGSR
jgi:hypothetical protein